MIKLSLYTFFLGTALLTGLLSALTGYSIITLAI